MFKIISAFSVMGFIVNFVMCVYEAVISNFAVSIGFGLMAVMFFFCMVFTGYLGLRK